MKIERKELEDSFILYGYVGSIMDGTPKERFDVLTMLTYDYSLMNYVREHLPNDLDVGGFEYLNKQDNFLI